MFQLPKPVSDQKPIGVPIDQKNVSPPWHQTENEGELKVDVLETDDAVIIRSTVAGVRAEDLDIFLNNDMLTIRGKRTDEHESVGKNFYLRECFWGKFSRSIILPKHVQTHGAEAVLKNGMLTVTLPKEAGAGNILVREEE